MLSGECRGDNKERTERESPPEEGQDFESRIPDRDSDRDREMEQSVRGKRAHHVLNTECIICLPLSSILSVVIKSLKCKFSHCAETAWLMLPSNHIIESF